MYPLLFSPVAIMSSVSSIKIRAPSLLSNTVFISSVAFLAEMSFWLSSVLAEILSLSFESSRPLLLTTRLLFVPLVCLMVNWLLTRIFAFSVLSSVLSIVSVTSLAAISFSLLSILAEIFNTLLESNNPLLFTTKLLDVALEIITGVLGNSSALIADGIHSFLLPDVLVCLMTTWLSAEIWAFSLLFSVSSIFNVISLAEILPPLSSVSAKIVKLPVDGVD